MQPFDKHPADPGALQAAGGDLVAQGAQALQTGQSTRQAYQPAIPAVTGDPAGAIATASEPVTNAADNSAAALVWASVATRYWGTQVQSFNAEVDAILARKAQAETAARDAATAAANAPGPDGAPAGPAAPGADPGPGLDQARIAAEAEWRRAYATYIEAGGARAQGMLTQGPTAANQQVARDAGAMPGQTDTLLTNIAQKTGSRFFVNPTLNQGLVGILGWGAERGMNVAAYSRDWWKSQNLKFQPRGANGQFVNRAQWMANTGALDRFRAYGSDKNWVPKANQAATWGRWQTYSKVAGRASPIVAAGTGAVDQWTRDAGRTDIDNGERVARAATRGGANALGAAGGAWAGAKIGALGGMWFGPAGAAIGGVGGAIIGGIGGAVAANYATDEVLEGT